MRSFLRLIARSSAVLLLSLLFSHQVQADPFGVQVGKTTIDEVSKKFTFSELSKNKYFGWNHRVKAPEQLKGENATEALFVCDDEGIVQAIALWKDKSLFEQELAQLEKKCKLIKVYAPKVGNKEAKFKDNNNIIELEVSYRIDSDLFILYKTPLFDKKYQEAENIANNS